MEESGETHGAGAVPQAVGSKGMSNDNLKDSMMQQSVGDRLRYALPAIVLSLVLGVLLSSLVFYFVNKKTRESLEGVISAQREQLVKDAKKAQDDLHLALAEQKNVLQEQIGTPDRQVAHILIRVADTKGKPYGPGWQTNNPEVVREREEQFKKSWSKIADLVPAAREDFAKAARKYSEDSESSAKGGFIGLIDTKSPLPANVDEAVRQAALALKPGAISDPIKSDYGWHLVMSLDKPLKKEIAEVRTEAAELAKATVGLQKEKDQLVAQLTNVAKSLEAQAQDVGKHEVQINSLETRVKYIDDRLKRLDDLQADVLAIKGDQGKLREELQTQYKTLKADMTAVKTKADVTEKDLADLNERARLFQLRVLAARAREAADAARQTDLKNLLSRLEDVEDDK